MKVKDFMSTRPICLSPKSSLKEAASLFLDNKIDGAPVVQNDKLLGIFTKTHLIRAMRDNTDISRTVSDFMTGSVKTVEPSDDVRDIDIMYTGRYPVVKNDNLVGFITKSDIMVGLNRVIEEISGQMETVINSAYNPIVAIDNEGAIRIWNKAAENLTGLGADYVLGKYINQIIPESELTKIVETGEREWGVRLRVAGHSMITNRAPVLNKNGEITGAVAVLYDVSELEKVSRELEYVKSLNAELDAIISSSFDGLYITDGQGVTLRINQACERISGLTEKDFVGKSMHELVSTGILSRSATILVLEQKQPATTTLTTITGATLLVSATPVFDENGNIFRVVTNVRDISELNMLKQKLEQLEGLKNHFESQMNQMRLQLSRELIFKNKSMENIAYMAFKVAEVDSTVLISGESGVGKEVIAEIIQRNGNRKDGPFVKLNCAAIPESLLESELFGYESGAFTGAKKGGKPGLFEVANEGTLLLDEIGDMPLHLQVKLLRAIQQREVTRVGGTQPIKIDVRIIAVTNKDLAALVKKELFREDLYYRLNVVPIVVPPLRERREDIPLLITHFMGIFNKRYDFKKTIAPEAIDILSRYSWPGNIRQLENLIERLMVTSSAELITVQHLPEEMVRTDYDITGDTNQPITVNSIIPLKAAVESVERTLLQKTLEIADSYQKAAEILEVDISTISRKAAKYKIKPRG
ncbi:MAG: sigma 54-interacting transcriptional regulator [Acidobacteriota bacterium]